MDRFLKGNKLDVSSYLANSMYTSLSCENVCGMGMTDPAFDSNIYLMAGTKKPDAKLVVQPYRQVRIGSLPDDFYSSLIDWSGDNVFFMADGNLLVHNFCSSRTLQMCSLGSFGVTSIKHNSSTNSVVLGTSIGVVLGIDMVSLKISKYPFHKSRVGVIEMDGTNIITGSRDRKIKITDLRSEKAVATILQHRQEVCGLGLSIDIKFLASGGNDNRLYIYDYRNLSHPIKQCSNHKAAVKAISWSPNFPNLFVSGGGTADKTIKLWDMNLVNSSKSSTCLIKSMDYGSQICNIRWLKSNKILSTHGYSRNDIRLSQIPSFKIEKYFVGHKNRVIHFSCSSNEKYFASGSCDSNINFWELGNEKDDEIKIR
ncbi:hypothetical protein HK407_03g06040 [Ordospora pajunii]|uniref:uncharacterized protein n=1 Tax=Ordospora pajunii TaxID=3039483 RepID=UPI0029527572|nr:uncharacterized protein HK407_03g06040 [Ordospora pajunii]KAH9411852.1 hypothetical protein HK407_03g06040 [Ordospora pajunii]